MIVHEQDIDAGFDVSVLEGIIEQYDINIFSCLTADEMVDAASTLAVDCYGDVGEFLLHLIRLVTNHLHRCLCIGKHKAVTLALVTTAEYGNIHFVFQQTYQVFYMGRLSCAANRDIAYGNDGNGIRPALQDAHLKEHVPEAYSKAIEPTEWEQLLVDIDEIAFHE